MRRAKEVVLARFAEFAIRGSGGSLDYHTESMNRSKKHGYGLKAEFCVVS